MSAFWRATCNYINVAVNTFAQNVLYFEEPTELLTAEQIGAKIDDNFWGVGTGNDSLRNYTSGNVRLQSITMQRMSPGPPQGGIPFVTQQRAGGQGTLVKHPGLGLLFTLKDGNAGKKGRGRFYHYGAVGSHLLDGGPSSGITTPTAIGLLIDRWQIRIGNNGSEGIHWCLYHRHNQGDARWTRVKTIHLSPICAFQRRRRVGIGF